MGERHQVFLIARVVPRNSVKARYRCVGAFHHHWCRGQLPLRATRRLLNLFANEDNAEIIRAELRAIQGKYWGRNVDLIPCPYTTFLMASAWCIDIENPAEPYGSGVSFNNNVLDSGMSSFGAGWWDLSSKSNPKIQIIFKL